MNQTKLSLAIAAMISDVAAAQGISKEQVSNGYTIAPTAVQIMYDEISQNTELLQKINLRPKTEKVGEVIGLSSGLIGSNTDTTGAGKERKPKPIHNLSGRKYTLEKTNFDAALRYDEIDQWAHLTDFPKHINKKIAESIALSLVTIGMNGTSRAADSDASANTMLQDVAKGWLQKMREENKSRCIGTTGTSTASVPYGPGATDYKNLDAVVTDALNVMMDERFADRSDFVVLASRRTVGDKYLRIVNKSGDTATEIESGGRLNKEST